MKKKKMLPSLPPTGSRIVTDFEIQQIHQRINEKKKNASLPPTHWKPHSYRLRNTTNTPKNK